MLALALCGPAQARLIEVAGNTEPAVSRGSPAQPRHTQHTQHTQQTQQTQHTQQTRQTQQIVVLQSTPSDLAEPQVLAMMLLGLCLIGYKARRDSSEKFK
jgi:hypothetical protein